MSSLGLGFGCVMFSISRIKDNLRFLCVIRCVENRTFCHWEVLEAGWATLLSANLGANTKTDPVVLTGSQPDHIRPQSLNRQGCGDEGALPALQGKVMTLDR